MLSLFCLFPDPQDRKLFLDFILFIVSLDTLGGLPPMVSPSPKRNSLDGAQRRRVCAAASPRAKDRHPAGTRRASARLGRSEAKIEPGRQADQALSLFVSPFSRSRSSTTSAAKFSTSDIIGRLLLYYYILLYC